MSIYIFISATKLNGTNFVVRVKRFTLKEKKTERKKRGAEEQQPGEIPPTEGLLQVSC